MSYLTCTNCGQKSPDSATRCKHCGRAFGRPPERPGDSGSRSSIPVAVLVTGAAVLIILAAYQLWPRFSVAPSAAAPDTTAVATPPPPDSAPRQSRAAPAESVRAVPAKPSRPPEESRAPAADTAAPVADTARPVAPTVSIDPAHQRYAQVWANLRAEPNNTATIVRVLQPGEVVAVDSLQQGWYRVVTDSQGVGYVAQQYLDTLPPSP